MGDDVEFDAAVFGAILSIGVGDEGDFGAESLGFEAFFVDAFFDEIFFDGFGASVGESDVVCALASVVGVPFDTDAELGAAFEDGDDLIKDAKGLALNGGAVEGKEDLLKDLDLVFGDFNENDFGTALAFFDAGNFGTFVKAVDNAVAIGIFVGATLVFFGAGDIGTFVFVVFEAITVFVAPRTTLVFFGAGNIGTFVVVVFDAVVVFIAPRATIVFFGAELAGTFVDVIGQAVAIGVRPRTAFVFFGAGFFGAFVEAVDDTIAVFVGIGASVIFTGAGLRGAAVVFVEDTVTVGVTDFWGPDNAEKDAEQRGTVARSGKGDTDADLEGEIGLTERIDACAEVGIEGDFFAGKVAFLESDSASDLADDIEAIFDRAQADTEAITQFVFQFEVEEVGARHIAIADVEADVSDTELNAQHDIGVDADAVFSVEFVGCCEARRDAKCDAKCKVHKVFVLAEGLGFQAEFDIAERKTAEVTTRNAAEQCGVVGDASILVDGKGDGEVDIQPIQDPETTHDIRADLVIHDAGTITAAVRAGRSTQNQWIECVIEVDTSHVVHPAKGHPRLGVKHPVDIAPRTELLELERGIKGSTTRCLGLGGRCEPANAQEENRQEPSRADMCFSARKGQRTKQHDQSLLRMWGRFSFRGGRIARCV